MLHAAGVTDGTLMILSHGQDTGSKVSESHLANLATGLTCTSTRSGCRTRRLDGSTLQSLASESGGTYAPTSPTAVVPPTGNSALSRPTSTRSATHEASAPKHRDCRRRRAGLSGGPHPVFDGQFDAAPGEPYLRSTAAAILGERLIVAVLIGLAEPI